MKSENIAHILNITRISKYCAGGVGVCVCYGEEGHLGIEQRYRSVFRVCARLTCGQAQREIPVG